jgi:hypothetical protein
MFHPTVVDVFKSNVMGSVRNPSVAIKPPSYYFPFYTKVTFIILPHIYNTPITMQ